MADIQLAPLGNNRFRVQVVEEESSTTHEVEISSETLDRLGWEGSLEALIRRSFEFMLDREPKESILEELELSMISRYFPDYEEQIGQTKQ
jgi:hypothetical protein